MAFGTFATISPADTGHASSPFSMTRRLGSATGITVLATVFTAIGTTHRITGHSTSNLTAYHIAFLVALVAIVPAITVHNADAASAIERQPATASR